MSDAVRDLRRAVFTRRNAVTVGVMAVLAVATLLFDGVAGYAASLSLFSVWMIGFVLTVVDLLRLRDD
jgi:hypothetical protein